MTKKFIKPQLPFKNKFQKKSRYENPNESKAKFSKKIHKQNKPINQPHKSVAAELGLEGKVSGWKIRKEKQKQKKMMNKNAKTKEEDLEITVDTKENFFVFDTDTSIFTKLKGEKGSKRKQNSWDYKKVIEEENELQKMRETEEDSSKNKKVTKSNEIAKNASAMEEDFFDEEENQINLLKYENDLFAKDTKFTDFSLSKLILKACSDLELFNPTKVQEKVIPIILKGNDVLVNSETGSGKTACYLLPVIQKIYQAKGSKSETKVMIILPTRELVYQCAEMLSGFLKYIDFITFVAISGGMSTEKQENELKNKPDIIISTPGRLIDLIYNYKAINIDDINILILDEADKLLELGFKDAIFEIIKLINKNNNIRQTLLFSATLNPSVLDLEKHALKDPVKIKLVHSAVLTNLKQIMVRMKFKEVKNDQNLFEKRMAYLLFILIKGDAKSRTIIFFNTKHDCHKAGIILRQNNLKFAELHGSIPQPQRLKSLNDFQNGETNYLLATDIAARGIDIEKVRFVINFQMPVEMDRYIHRIGRTARKGYIGTAITICDEKDRLKLKKLSKKENSTLSLLKIENESIKTFYKSLIGYKEDVNAQFEDDQIEEELKKAEMEVTRSINITKHKSEILNKPKKSWYQSKKQKKDIDSKVKSNLGKKDMETD